MLLRIAVSAALSIAAMPAGAQDDLGAASASASADGISAQTANQRVQEGFRAVARQQAEQRRVSVAGIEQKDGVRIVEDPLVCSSGVPVEGLTPEGPCFAVRRVADRVKAAGMDGPLIGYVFLPADWTTDFLDARVRELLARDAQLRAARPEERLPKTLAALSDSCGVCVTGPTKSCSSPANPDEKMTFSVARGRAKLGQLTLTCAPTEFALLEQSLRSQLGFLLKRKSVVCRPSTATDK